MGPPHADEKETTQHIEELGGSQRQRVYVPGSPEEKALLRKIDMRLIPQVWLMYCMSYLDRANIGNAKVAGMEHDLNLTSERYSIALLVFFIGYMLGEVPSNMVLTRLKPSWYLPLLMLVWGGISMGLAGVQSWKTLSVVRVLLGFAEAGFAPGVMYLLASWYRKNELARRYCLFYSGSSISGALGGLLAGAITDNLEDAAGLASWRWLFLIEGSATCAIAIVAVFILPDFPLTTSWLSEDERWLAQARIEADNISATAEEGHWESFKSALSDWRTWIFTLAYMLVTGAQTIQYFIPTIVGTLGYKGTAAQYYTIPIYAVATAGIIVLSFSSDFCKERGYHLSGSTAFAAICFVILATVDNAKLKYAFVALAVGGIYAACPITLVWTSNVVSWPAEKRAITGAWVNALGNGASIYGSFLYPKQDGPKYVMGLSVTAAMMFAASINALVIKFATKRYPLRVPQVEDSLDDEKDRVSV